MIKKMMDNVNAIKEIAEPIQNIELRSLIVDLKEQLIDLREENQELKEKLSKKEDLNMLYEQERYWNIK